ncbi:hypothetical protein K8O68_06385 [Salipaludibacillus sp. CUR1]|uniref:hypothetical protein n=1 Tax=Salipaludibacillus sp. CUR1 TaxID=2820003 RepID=UPI001E657723|nr:hypothetical protein [Salipaludibacillus sp. CUR1]MCE7792049.1 hypothetical protein [Salipaludibacillus sp. CUR1]
MMIRTFLIVIIIIMQFSTLINVTLFDGEWNGLVLALHTALFILAIGINTEIKKLKQHRNN